MKSLFLKENLEIVQVCMEDVYSHGQSEILLGPQLSTYFSSAYQVSYSVLNLWDFKAAWLAFCAQEKVLQE